MWVRGGVCVARVRTDARLFSPLSCHALICHRSSARHPPPPQPTPHPTNVTNAYHNADDARLLLGSRDDVCHIRLPVLYHPRS